MEPPSQELVQILARLGLARPDSLPRLESLVRRVSGGLPIHDGIWIDALVRRGMVTSYQAKLLDDRRPGELQVGEKYVLLRPCHVDPVMSRYQGREIASGRSVLVTRIPRIFGDNESADRLRAVAGAREICLSSGTMDVVSPPFSGESLARFLVRRGRFPENVVQGLALAILEKLVGTGSESTGIHGDLRIENLLLDRRGQVAVLNAGVRLALFPQLTLHTRLPLDAYDGLAPELLDPGTTASQASDLYSLGCLLWQLLAGRPPILSADPLAKIRHHRTQSIPDVRRIAPETSPRFAAWIKHLTAREPHHRPRSYQDALSPLRPWTGKPGPRLRQFVVAFESAAPRPGLPQRRSTGVTVQAALMIAATIALVAVFWSRSHWGIPALPRAAAETSDSRVDSKERETPVKETSPHPEPLGQRPMPLPDSQGVIELESDGDYLASSVTVSGPLRIRGPEGRLARLHLPTEPLRILGTSVAFDNIEFVFPGRVDHSQESFAIVIESRELILRRCVATPAEEMSNPATFLHWNISSAGEGPNGRLLVRDSNLSGMSSFLQVGGPLTVALFEDVQKTGPGVLLAVEAGAAPGFRVPVRLDHCTLTGSGPLLKVLNAERFLTSGLLSIQGRDSRLQLTSGASLVHLPEGVELEPWEQHLEIVAERFILSADVEKVSLVPAQGEGTLPLPADDLKVVGLQQSEDRVDTEPSRAQPDELLRENTEPTDLPGSSPGVRRERLPVPVRSSRAQ